MTKANLKRHRALRTSLGAAALIALAAHGADGAAAADAAGAAEVGPTPALRVEHAEKGLLLGIADAGGQLVAVGGHGDIVRSADGEHWVQVPSPVDVTLTAVSFADDRNGWAVGHDAVILHTADGGQTWTVQNFQPDLNAPLFSVLALDGQRALAAGAFGTLKLTEDGGAHWSDVAAAEVTGDKLHLNAVTRLAGGALFVVGEHGLAALSADGHAWQRLTTPYDGSFFGVQPWGAQGVIAFGMRGNVYAMSDVRGGAWQKIDVGGTSSLFGGVALADGNALLSGADGTLVAVNGEGKAGRLAAGNGAQGQATTYAGVVGYGGALMVVGEAGVARITP